MRSSQCFYAKDPSWQSWNQNWKQVSLFLFETRILWSRVRNLLLKSAQTASNLLYKFLGATVHVFVSKTRYWFHVKNCTNSGTMALFKFCENPFGNHPSKFLIYDKKAPSPPFLPSMFSCDATIMSGPSRQIYCCFCVNFYCPLKKPWITCKT